MATASIPVGEAPSACGAASLGVRAAPLAIAPYSGELHE